MSVFKERRYRCSDCGGSCDRLAWDYNSPPDCPEHGPMIEDGGTISRTPGVIDDQLEGGPRFFEHMGPKPVWIESKSQWRKEVDKRQLVNVVRHDSAYYAKRRNLHDQELRDTGTNREY